MFLLNMFKFKTFMFLCIIVFQYQICDSKGVYEKLLKDLFENYSLGVRPVLELNQTINVGIAFGIIQLLDVGDKTKTVECVAFTALSWRDYLLTWNPKNYSNITQFRYPHTNIWKPDIILINTPDLNEGPVMNKASTNVIIKADGTIWLEYTSVYKATCQAMDMTKFPFDHHDCRFDFTSWTYPQAELDVYDGSSEFDVADSMKLVPNSEWDVSMNGTEKIVEYDVKELQSYPTWRIKFRLVRKPLYFLVNIILPITITCYISFLGMFSPSTNTGERTEKAFLGITTLLAVALLMLTVSAQMPVTSNSVPLMGYFLGVYILTIAIAIICTTVIMHIDVQGLNGQPLPKWVKWLFLEKIGKWLRIYYVKDENKMTKVRPDSAVKNLCYDAVESDYMKAKTNQKEILTIIDNMLNIHLEHFFNGVREKTLQKEHIRIIRKEWSDLCTVLDRICLVVFLTWSTVFTIAMLSN